MSGATRNASCSIFSSKLVCGDCGEAYGRKTWHSTDAYRKTIWQCNGKYRKKGHPCKTPTISEDDIKEAFIRAENILLKGRKERIEDAEALREIVSDTSALEQKKEILAAEMSGIAKALDRDILQNIADASDQAAYMERRKSLEEQWSMKKEEFDRADAEISDKVLRASRIEAFISVMRETDSVADFSPQEFGALVKKATVQRGGEIEFEFVDGSVVRA